MSYFFWLGRDSYRAEVEQAHERTTRRWPKTMTRLAEADGFITVHPKLKD